MPQFGLALLGVVALLVATTGLPVFIVLLATSCLGAMVGVASGTVPLALLGALPSRLIGLLENDLLQAVPLFVLIGALLDRLPLADLLYRAGFALNYNIRLWLKASLLYDFQKFDTDSNLAVDYDDNRVSFRVSVGY